MTFRLAPNNFFFSMIIALIASQGLFAQGGMGGRMGAVTTGRLYGKVVDSTSGKAIEYATVQLFQNVRDTVSGEVKQKLAGGQLTESNGDFSIEGLPLNGDYLLRIAFIGYIRKEIKVSFGGRGSRITDKDLGNIRLRTDAKMLGTVTVDGSEPAFRLEIDKKVYDLEKNPVASGTTAEDALKNVPSVNVDIDGNVSLRNATPQIFVDGRPTTLALDQIPADAIQSIELITNPSAKYDASGGMAGIINIVLKKNRKIGYNGSVRAGIDMRGKINGGADLNAREKKVNVFVNGNYSQRRSEGTSTIDRQNLSDNPLTIMAQEGASETESHHASAKLGFDYFIDNRNTLTVSGSYNEGAYRPSDVLQARTDTQHTAGVSTSYFERSSTSKRGWSNLGGTAAYKRLFPKAGKELTADVSYNRNKGSSEAFYQTQNFDAAHLLSGTPSMQRSNGSSGNYYITAQADLVNPFTEKIKIESGLKYTYKNSSSTTRNYLFDSTASDYLQVPSLTGSYEFIDQVSAAYTTFSQSLGKFGYQAGLRLESSDYKTTLPDSSISFRTSYPVSLFPSAFLNYKLSEKNNLQLNYSRRINRPSYFQLLPFTDYTDSLNISRGNPYLLPEFTHSLELSFQRVINRSNSFLVSAYFKNSTDLITRYQVFEYSTYAGKDVVINTYENANSSYAYGMEFTSKSTIKTWFDVTFNFNIYNSVIDAGNIEAGLGNEQLSWFSKLNTNFKLPANITFQVTGSYKSRAAMPVSSGGERGGGGGGGGWFGKPTSTIQGYTEPEFEIDLALKIEFLKDKRASATISVSDVFKTEVSGSYSASPYFIQTTTRKRDQQLVRLNFSYSFGKFDASIFKRRNNNTGAEGGEM